MKYKYSQVTNKDEWEKCILDFPEANFLQSWNWGEFQSSLGKKVIRIQVKEADRTVCLFSLVKEVAKRGTYLALAGGPLCDWSDDALLSFVFETLQLIGKQEDADFIRFRPQEINTDRLEQKLANLGAKPAQMHLTADLTLQLDLTKSESDLLMEMRKNHRSAIRKSSKLGITIKHSQNPNEIQTFYDLQIELAEKHGFIPFGYEFLHEQFKAFSKDNQVELISAYTKDNELLATAYVIFYNGEAVYHYGVSSDLNRNLPGSYASQWAAITQAKKRGCKRYNFWGIAPKDMTDHRFSGVSLFKRGFGGEEVQYVPAHDVPLSPLYTATAAFEFIRKKVRKL